MTSRIERRERVVMIPGDPEPKRDAATRRPPEFVRGIVAEPARQAVTDAGSRQPDDPTGLTWTVKAGETLEDVAAATGVPVRRLAEANRLGGVAGLEPGQQLIVPTR